MSRCSSGVKLYCTTLLHCARYGCQALERVQMQPTGNAHERCGCNGGCLKATGHLNEKTNFCVQFRKYSPAKPPITIPCFDAVETHVPRHEPTIPPNKAFRKVVFDKEQSSSGLEYSVQRIRCMIEPIEDEL